MLLYFIFFTIIGIGIGLYIEEKKKAFISIFILSLLWLLIYGDWALFTLGELLLGYFIAMKYKRYKK